MKITKLRKPFPINFKKRSVRLTILALVLGIFVAKLLLNKATEVKADTLLTFDEGYGTTASDTNVAVTAGTITNAVWKSSEYCVYNNCLYFDGSGDYVTYSDAAVLDMAASDNVTVEGWFRTTDITSGSRTIVSKNNTSTSSDGGYKVTINSSGQIVFGIDSNNTSFPSSSVTSALSYDDNKWHHFAAIKNGTTNISLYIDGGNVGTTSISSTDASNSDSLQIGHDDNGVSSDWLGFLDEIKVLRTARSAAEVKADFTGATPNRGSAVNFGPNNTVVSSGLVGYWPLDSAVNDNSGNGGNLTNNGSTTYVTGKYGNGSEHVPASSQHFNITAAAGDVYYFDSSDTECINGGSVWANSANFIDSDTATYASTTELNTSLYCEGTNAPGTGSTITSVEATFYGCIVDAAGSEAYIEATVLTNDGMESLGTITILDSGTCTIASQTGQLSAPGGGWSWATVSSLEVSVSASDDSNVTTARAAAVTLTVNTGSATSTPVGVKTVSFWTNPDSTTNYYVSLNASSYITSTSGTLASTGFTNPKYYVNGAQTTTIAADTWQHVVVTSESPINASQFYIGRQGSNYYDGTLDEVRLYNSTYGQSEVSKLYNWVPGPLGYWNFDENSGTQKAYDKSTYSYNLDFTSNDASTWTTGKFGSAYFVDGSADYATATPENGSFSVNNYTVGAWIYRKTDSGGIEKIIDNQDADNDGWSLWISSTDKPTCAYNSTDSAGTTSIAVNTWYHIECTSDGSNLKTYVNGIMELSTSITGSISETTDLRVGAQSYGTSEKFAGVIDDAKFYSYPRTPAQVVEDLNAGHPTPGSPVGSVTGYWAFDEGYGTTANDRGPNANALTLSTATSAWTNNGKINKAWDGNGTRYLSRTNDNDFDVGTDDFSFSFWFKSDNIGGSGTQYIINRAIFTEGFAIYGISTGNIVFGVDDDISFGPDASVTSTKMLYDQTWHHIVAVKTGTSKLDLYVDGRLESSTTSSIPTGTLSNDLTFYLGDRDGTDNGDELIGDLDEVKFYRLALTADQVKVEYNLASQTVMGSTSTNASNQSSWSAKDEYCPPGQGSTCTPPVAEWKMDENVGGVLQDSSGNDNPSTLWSGNMSYAPGKFSSGLFFDGADDVVRINPNLAYLDNIGGTSDSYSVTAWFKTTHTANTPQGIVSKIKSASGAYPFRLFISANPKTLNFILTDGTTNCQAVTSGTTSPNVNDGKWHHAAGVWDTVTNFVYIYLDGVFIEKTLCTISDATSFANSDDISIGNARNGGLGDYTQDDFNGYLDQIRIYDYARTQAQIDWEFGHGTPTVGWWKLDDNVSEDAKTLGDSTIWVKHGTTVDGANNTGMDCTVEAKRNKGCDLDGTDDSITMGDNASPHESFLSDGNDFSIAGWFNRDTANSNDVIISKRAGYTNGENGFVIWIDSSTNKLTFEGCDFNVSCDEYMLQSTNTFASPGWNHFVLVWDDDNENNTMFYINGVPETVARTGTFANIGNLGGTVGTINLRLGTLNNGTTDPFDGKIDEIMMFGHALTAQEIKNIYNQGAVRFGPTSGSP
jgi:hypothetical protein